MKFQSNFSSSFISSCVLYEDQDMLVINKPDGLIMSDPKSESLSGHLYRAGYGHHHIVHRLDARTSGVVLVARHREAASELCRQFREREVDKIYESILYTDNSSSFGNHHISQRLNTNADKVVCGIDNGQSAITLVKTHGDSSKAFNQRGGNLVQVSMFPITGRRHQLRVHMSDVLHAPILGDMKYGVRGITCGLDRKETALKHMHLHAAKIRFTHPRTGDEMKVSAPLPFYMKETVDRYGINNDYDRPIGSEDMIRAMKDEILWWQVKGQKQALVTSAESPAFRK